MINNFYEEEILLNIINHLSYEIVKTLYFIIFDKEWLEKWKKIVGYEIIKDKCKNYQNREELKKEINKLFTKLKTKQRLEELGKMDCSKYKRNNLFDISNLSQLNDLYNFVPIINNLSFFFINYIKEEITASADISYGKIYIQEPFPEKDKNKDKKILVLFKEDEKDNEYKRYIITLERDANIKKLIKALNNITIEEFMNKYSSNDEIFQKLKLKKIENLKDIEEMLKENEKEESTIEEKKTKEKKEKKEKKYLKKKRNDEEREKKRKKKEK